ncbi:MAG: cytochrome c oxidase subunit 4, partial [Chloroflexota bacterium]
MLERLWTSILGLMTQLVTPDWGKLIGLLPVGMLVLVVLILLRLFAQLMTAPKPRRGKARIAPKTPSTIHMPGPSFAPVFAAIGMFLLLLGLVFGGVAAILGAIALVLTLFYWLAEGLRLYDRDIGAAQPAVPAVVHEGPPPGVHMPGPSWQPFLAAFGMFTLLLGLVFGEWILAVGIIALVASLIGWLGAAVREYRKVQEADQTGHLENPPPSKTPSRLFATLVV